MNENTMKQISKAVKKTNTCWKISLQWDIFNIQILRSLPIIIVGDKVKISICVSNRTITDKIKVI